MWISSFVRAPAPGSGFVPPHDRIDGCTLPGPSIRSRIRLSPSPLRTLPGGPALGRDPSPEEFAAYVYGLLGGSPYTRYFWTELETREVRVPLTKDRNLFERAAAIGRTLLRLHTYGDRFVPRGRKHGELLQSSARCVRAVSSRPEDYPADFTYDGDSLTLRVGDGAFAPVVKEVWDFSVSGKVLTWD